MTFTIFNMAFGWYSGYKFESSLGNELYQAEKKKRKNLQADHKMEVAECIANRREFVFNTVEKGCLNLSTCATAVAKKLNA